MKKFFAPALVLTLVCTALAGCARDLDIRANPRITNPVVDVRTDPDKPLMAGFASEVITPRGPVWIAGFGMMRMSLGVHDDIFARALVVSQGNEKLALVSVDLIGVQLADVLAIKAVIAGFRPDQVLIASTHTHSGPDTLGLWGLPPVFSGRDKHYMKRLGEAVARAVERADAARTQVSAFTAVFPMNPEIMYNANQGEPKDDVMGVMVFKAESGAVVATLINLAGHPECMWSDNHIITADYPGVVYAGVEKKYGGGAIFFNGALGAMITPRLPQSAKGRSWKTMEQTGGMILADIDRGMGLLVREERPKIVHRMSYVLVPAKNDQFLLLARTGILDREVYEGPSLLTEVHVIEIGSAQFVTFPGEDYPKQGINIRAHQKPNSFQIGLADDELGYILYPSDYGTELYRYETSMCAGPELSTKMEEALLELLRE